MEVAGSHRIEGTLQARLRNQSGGEIAHRHFQAGGTGIWGDFFFRIDVPTGKPDRPRGTLETFEFSAEDGSEVNKHVIPIVYAAASCSRTWASRSHGARGQTLSSIADQWHGDPDEFPIIFEANRNQLTDRTSSTRSGPAHPQ